MISMDKYNFKGKKVLVRVDFNVPLNENHEVTDDTRIVAAIPTILKILTEGGSVILMTHIGRPKGKFNPDLSTKHIIGKVSELLGRKVKYAPDCIGPEVEKMAAGLQPGEVLMLENLRFYPEETKGDEEFAKKLAKLGDAFVMNAFGTVHRAHASTFTIAKFFPYDKMFGYLVESELTHIDKALKDPKRPFTAIIGGSKVSTKISIIENLLPKVDNLIIAGGIVYTLIKAMGGKIGDSLVEDDYLDVARNIIEKAKKYHVNLVLPIDAIVADKFSNDANIQHFPIDQIPDGWMGLDIGIKSQNKFMNIIENSQTILWNGPIGVFEFENFTTGTLRVALAVARATDLGAYSLVGGGDSVAAINQYNLANRISYVSTGGGAMLEYLEGKTLPGIAAIKESFSIDDVDFNGKKVLMRVDFNVPLKDGEIVDDTRIVSALPTIMKILSDNGSVVLLSHLGRPKGEYVPELSNKQLIPYLSKALGREVKFAPDCIGSKAEKLAAELKPGEVLLLENLRFHPEETKGDWEFAKKLAKLGDIYVMNAFGTVHRYHSSVYHIAKFFEGRRYFGYLVESEMHHIDRALYHAEKPFTAILGGSKISTKIQIIEALLNRVDNLLIAGGIAFNFIKAKGGKVGDSIVEDDYLDVAKRILDIAEKKNVKIYLPIDAVTANEISDDPEIIEHHPIDNIPKGQMGVDIGIKSQNMFMRVIENSKTVLWNGPIGVFEIDDFANGTLRVALAVARATDLGAYTVAGGGDTTSALNKFHLQNRISYISTAGGALLEYIEGKELPGIKAIKGKFDKE